MTGLQRSLRHYEDYTRSGHYTEGNWPQRLASAREGTLEWLCLENTRLIAELQDDKGVAEASKQRKRDLFLSEVRKLRTEDIRREAEGRYLDQERKIADLEFKIEELEQHGREKESRTRSVLNILCKVNLGEIATPEEKARVTKFMEDTSRELA